MSKRKQVYSNPYFDQLNIEKRKFEDERQKDKNLTSEEIVT